MTPNVASEKARENLSLKFRYDSITESHIISLKHKKIQMNIEFRKDSKEHSGDEEFVIPIQLSMQIEKCFSEKQFECLHRFYIIIAHTYHSKTFDDGF